MYTDNIAVAEDTKYVDLRSDTVTRACPEMRKVMAEAIVGDDVYSEDPTVLALEQRCAKLFNKEAALFVVSGTMGNLLSIMAHTLGRGEILIGRTSHIQRWELGGYARIAGVSAVTIDVNPDGTLNLGQIKEAICPGDCHRAQTKLICVENTQNFTGGKAISVEYMQKIRDIADSANLKVHVDGARLFNAAVKLGVSVAELTKHADSVQMCFSKGLGAPVGTIITGTTEFIRQARLDRKVLGGGWRQAGHLAAAAMYALDHGYDWIAADNNRAVRLAQAINQFGSKKITADEDGITNMVLVTVADPENAVSILKKHGVLAMHFDVNRIRAVIHRDIDDAGIEKAINAFQALA
uniref:Beta_elim_lyase domain-containing protein n=1 Tax=Panagrellus redivivus TaxID=6233 RepID=A0A7E4VFU9_PANRE